MPPAGLNIEIAALGRRGGVVSSDEAQDSFVSYNPLSPLLPINFKGSPPALVQRIPPRPNLFLTFGPLWSIMGAMVNVARRTIVLSLSILHLALVLPSTASSVTCVGSDGLVKIEANCEQSCICDDQTTVATGPGDSDGRATHEHDGCGDCTHFFLSTFLQASHHSSRLNSSVASVAANAFCLALSGPYLADQKSQRTERCDRLRPLLTQKIASLKTTIVIC